MASIGQSGSKSAGGRRSLDAELNLVPFIDLLSMCICFLLMTAVWIQVGELEVKQSHGTEAAASVSLDMDLRFLSASTAELKFSKNGKAQKKAVFKAASFEALLTQLDAGLDGAIVGAGGNKKEGAKLGAQIGSALLTPTKALSYGQLVGVMDLLRRHEIVNLGVVPSQG